MNFDRYVNRENTASYKWDQRESLFGAADVVPMWVADMDFQAPEAVIQALKARAEQGTFGYTLRPESYYASIQGWLARRHGWEVPKEWITTCPTLMTALAILVETLTEPGDEVIVQSPVYYSFYRVVPQNGRKIVESSLRFENGRYVMDYDDLEAKMKAGAKLMLLCSPHNPVGRVWEREELVRLGELCAKHNVLVVADEIHFDLVYPGVKHTMFGTISDAFAENSVTMIAPTKTFNLAGLQTSNLIIPNTRVRRLFNQRLTALALHLENYFGVTATEAAYTHGDAWVDELRLYLQGNLNHLTDFVAQHLPEIKVIEPQGTYLVWLDFRALGMKEPELLRWMHNEARVALSAGTTFGAGGEGFLRMNIACPRSTLVEGLNRLHRACRERNEASLS